MNQPLSEANTAQAPAPIKFKDSMLGQTLRDMRKFLHIAALGFAGGAIGSAVATHTWNPWLLALVALIVVLEVTFLVRSFPQRGA